MFLYLNECSSTYFWSAPVVHAKWARHIRCDTLGGRHKVSLNNYFSKIRVFIQKMPIFENWLEKKRISK